MTSFFGASRGQLWVVGIFVVLLPLVWLLRAPVSPFFAPTSGGGTLSSMGKEDAINLSNPAALAPEPDVVDVWHPSLAKDLTGSVVASRYAWATEALVKPNLEMQFRVVPVSKICLNTDKEVCVSEALAATALGLPHCIMGHLFVRATYIRDENIVSIVEMSNELRNTKSVLFCRDGSVPQIRDQHLTGWIHAVFPKITHMVATIICPAINTTIDNAMGLVFVNYLGECHLPKNPIPADPKLPALLPSHTTIHLYLTPITKSFEQAFPTIPRRSFAYRTQPKHALIPFQFSTCAMAGVVDTYAPFFTHWLWHAKYRVGFEHVVMYTAPELFQVGKSSAHINTSFVRELIASGFLQLIPWHSHYTNSKEIFYRSQSSSYQDYIYRFRGLCHFTFFADVDDFFVSWPTNHSMEPVLQAAVTQYPDTEVFHFPWPTMLPECQNITGLTGPFDTDSLLPVLNYGFDLVTNHKQAINSYDLLDVGIHKSVAKITKLYWPGLATYHVRSGDLSKRGLANYSPEACAPFLLKNFTQEERKRTVWKVREE